jgi:hypothetical protein
MLTVADVVVNEVLVIGHVCPNQGVALHSGSHGGGFAAEKSPKGTNYGGRLSCAKAFLNKVT